MLDCTFDRVTTFIGGAACGALCVFALILLAMWVLDTMGKHIQERD